MISGKTIFSQLIDFIPLYEFRQCVARYNGNYKVIRFSCWDQFLCMAFAQLTYRESMRDIQACLRGTQHKRYHMGIRGKVSRNTLANANQMRDWRIYADFAQVLINMDCHLRVCSGSYSQKGTETGPQSLHNSIDFECDPFRENAHITSTFKEQLHTFNPCLRQPVESIQLTLGQ